MFDKLCYESLGIVPPTLKTSPLDEFLDVVILNSESCTNETWKPSDGVTPEMLNYICNKLKISCYAFDFTNKCF